MTATILRADARQIPLPDASVDLIVTSPPYFALRSYTDGGEHYAGQIGAEPTPAEYIASLIACTREWVRVLKPSGSMFVNLGDKYTGGGGQWDKDERPDPNGLRTHRSNGGVRGTSSGGKTYGYKPKSLMMLPERYRIAAVDELGLIARAVLVWSKPNGLPESVTDRVRRSHEDWVHLTKQPRYFSAVDEIRETYAPGTAERYRAGYKQNGRSQSGQQSTPSIPLGVADLSTNPLGKLPGSVWEIATEPLKVPDHLGVDHFAAFPTEWPRRIVLGWSPSGICTACGEPRRDVWEATGKSTYAELKEAGRMTYGSDHARNGSEPGNVGQTKNERGTTVTYVAKPRQVIGQACACPDTSAPTRPSVVLDPFGGTGTTALVASVLGRHGISVDMSADYCRLARWRTTDPGQRAKAARVTAPPKQLEGQQDLFTMEAVA